MVPIRWIGEQHVREDCQGRIPSLADWLGRIQPAQWMANGQIESAAEIIDKDPRVVWKQAVASDATTLGFRDWLAARSLTAAAGGRKLALR